MYATKIQYYIFKQNHKSFQLLVKTSAIETFQVRTQKGALGPELGSEARGARRRTQSESPSWSV